MTMADGAATALRRRTLLALAVSAIGLAGAPVAAAPEDPVDLKVVDRETGQALRVWPHAGRLFVAGQPGGRYSVRVANHTGGRVLVVMSVDGVNVISGETAAYGQTGYVLGPYESYDVNGWRKSDTEVAAFTFAPLPQSYAARTGRPFDVGVIGIAVFKERVVAPMPISPARGFRLEEPLPAPPPPAAASRAAPSPPASRAAPSDAAVVAEQRVEKLGTGHGAREWSAVTNVAFERATSAPQFVRRIEYDTYDNLLAAGVIRPPRDGGRWPRPFPNSRGGPYVPDPPGEP